jgi:large subunit ribosomal protein L10
MPKAQKIEIVDNIKKQLDRARAIFVTDFTGLNVADITLLRRNLRRNSAMYFVAKNTLLKIAAKQSGYDSMIEYLQGPTAIALGFEDPTAPAKILYDCYKEKEKPVVRAFVLDRQLFPGSQVQNLAELPPREVLLSGLVTVIESPVRSVLGCIDGLFQKLIGTLEALRESRE